MPGFAERGAGVIADFVVVLPGCGCVEEEGAAVFVPQAASTMMRRKETVALEIGSFGDFLKWVSFIIDPPGPDQFGLH